MSWIWPQHPAGGASELRGDEGEEDRSAWRRRTRI